MGPWVKPEDSGFRKLASLANEISLAGAGGVEPPYGGIKIRCLTTWLRPNARRLGIRGDLNRKA